MEKEKYIAYVGTYTHGSSIGIHLYDVDVEEGTLSERKVVPVNNSSYVVKSKNGKYLYSIADEGVAVFEIKPDGDLELINKVGVFTYKATDKGPEFELIQLVEPLSDQLDPMHDCGAAMTMSPDGKYLFTSTAGDDSVAMFAINPDDGTLTKEFALPISGEYPKDIALFPDGKHLAVVNHESNSITTFAIDYEKKLIVMKGKPMKVETPNCILMTNIEVE